MRFLAILPFLVLAACGGQPRQGVDPAISRPPPAPPQVQAGGPLIGLSEAALVARFGGPILRIPEGQSYKLQWRGAACILDAYFYPQRGAPQPVALHADARDVYGRDVDLAACIAALDRTPSPTAP
ncbi:hypothetical protein [Sphingomicrobium flavum]|uniref:hypothetical protein n=1 Tax=Sphingomicrobium flavum TaxID=1229164 RepID=UPI0021AD6B24|nr:hypothetical protein [Sphingomicrobium flavum]